MNILVDLANITYFVSYSVRSVLWLRIFAIVAGALLLPYYYYQPTPLMVPVYWGFAFIALNMYWVIRLLLERRPVTLTEEQQRLYRLSFRTLKPREMLELLKFARWEDQAAGEILIREGEPQARLSIVVNGRCGIRMQGADVGEVREGQFLGELSFLTDEKAPVSVVALNPIRIVSWHKDELRKFLKGKSELLNALDIILGTDMGEALKAAYADQRRLEEASATQTSHQ